VLCAHKGLIGDGWPSKANYIISIHFVHGLVHS
jgi:hypothetical protein